MIEILVPYSIVQGDRFSAFRPDSRDTAKDTSHLGAFLDDPVPSGPRDPLVIDLTAQFSVSSPLLNDGLVGHLRDSGDHRRRLRAHFPLAETT